LTTTSVVQVEDALSRYRRFLRIEATLIIAATLGAFTLNGYVYLEKYYNTLNVPIDRLNLGAQKLAIYGSASITAVVAASLAGIAAVLGITVVLALFDRPNRVSTNAQEVPPWLIRFRQRAAELTVSLKLSAIAITLALVCLSTWYLTMSFPSDNGRKAAFKTASRCHERTLTYRNLDRVTGCQVAESEDMFFLLKRSRVDDVEVSFHTLEVPKDGLLKSETQEEVLKFEP
jgi:hypothetical protein